MKRLYDTHVYMFEIAIGVKLIVYMLAGDDNKN